MLALTEDDRAYLIGRLDRSHIEGVAAMVRDALDHDRPVEACYQPGDATAYALLFFPAGHLLAHASGGGTGGYPGTRFFPDCHVVVYCQRETVAAVPEHSDAEWVAGKLTDNVASALAIAELLRAVGIAS